MGARTVTDDLDADSLGDRARQVIDDTATGVDVEIAHDYLHPATH
jgi:hypothetical protein